MHEEHEAGHHHAWGGECGCGGQKHGHFPVGGEHHMHRHEDDQEFEGPGFVGGPRGFRGPVRRGPRGPFRGGPDFFGRGPKAARGDIRLAILRLIQEQPMHGYQIIQDLENRTNGAWKPSPGSIYPTLQALEDQGLLIAEVVESKRVFTLTDAGRDYLNGLATGPLPWETVTKDTGASLFALRDQIKSLAIAVMQLAQSGGDEQVEKAKGILLEAKKKIYLILAEQDES